MKWCVVLKQDENIYINNFNYYSMLGGTEELGFTAQSVIMGDVVNISENDLFYQKKFFYWCGFFSHTVFSFYHFFNFYW